VLKSYAAFLAQPVRQSVFDKTEAELLALSISGFHEAYKHLTQPATELSAFWLSDLRPLVPAGQALSFRCARLLAA